MPQSLYRVGHKYCYKIKHRFIPTKIYLTTHYYKICFANAQGTIWCNFYSKCLPCAFTTLRSLLGKSSIAARTTFKGILSQHLVNFFFRASIFWQGVEQASFSRIDHKE
uniref:Uncharacterized protein n=1 Tax=Octopus bimaculoides TaxID=37653 RepID=A0A0L8G1U3_OCTBM